MLPYVEVKLDELCYILDELRARRNIRNRSPQYGELTLKLMAMEVGQVIEISPRSQSAITTCRRTARKAMGVDGRWHCTTLKNGHIQIERRPDGSAHVYGKEPSNLGIQLASMQVDDVIIIPKGTSLYNGPKVQARNILGDARAQWRRTNMANGTARVVRVL